VLGASGMTLEIKKASGTQDGYLASTDFTGLSNKQDNITIGSVNDYLKGDLTLTSFAPSVLGNLITGHSLTTGSILTSDSILTAINKLDGNIANKWPQINKSNIISSITPIISITGGTNAVIGGSDLTISISESSNANGGYISNSNYTSFNNKLDQTQIDNITLEVSSNLMRIKSASITSTKVNNGAVNDAKISNISRGKIQENIINETATINVTSTDIGKSYILTGSGITVNLPDSADANVNSGFTLTIKALGGNTVTIAGYSTQKIDNQNTYNLTRDKESISIVCDGANWHVVGKYTASL